MLLHRLHIAVHGGAQLIHELLDFLFGGAAFERLAQRLLGVAQACLGVGDVAVLDADRHLPQPRGDVAQIVVGLGANQRPEDRAQPEINAGVRRELFRRHRERVERRRDQRTRAGIEREIAALLDQRPRQRLEKTRSGRRKLNGSLLPSLPPSSWAISVITTSAPAHG